MSEKQFRGSTNLLKDIGLRTTRPQRAPSRYDCLQIRVGFLQDCVKNHDNFAEPHPIPRDFISSGPAGGKDVRVGAEVHRCLEPQQREVVVQSVRVVSLVLLLPSRQKYWDKINPNWIICGKKSFHYSLCHLDCNFVIWLPPIPHPDHDPDACGAFTET